MFSYNIDKSALILKSTAWYAAILGTQIVHIARKSERRNSHFVDILSSGHFPHKI